jgi:hypothetical protein|nr:MAG TPA: Minor capsid protein [Caudoviricetes sp.]
MSLSMYGHIDNVFHSGIDVEYCTVGEHWNAEGLPATGDAIKRTPFYATVQPLSPRETQALGIADERIGDYRKIYINSGDIKAVTLNGWWEMLGERWKPVSTDLRPARDYLKVIVARYDV